MPDQLTDREINEDLQICHDAVLETWHPENWDAVTMMELHRRGNTMLPFLQRAINDFPAALTELQATRLARPHAESADGAEKELRVLRERIGAEADKWIELASELRAKEEPDDVTKLVAVTAAKVYELAAARLRQIGASR